MTINNSWISNIKQAYHERKLLKNIRVMASYFEYIDLYASKDKVLGITFSNNEEYIDYCSKFEHRKKRSKRKK